MISTADLEKALVDHLPKQRWYAGRGEAAPEVTVRSVEVLRPGPPGLVRVLAAVGPATYQLVCGVRLVADEAAVLEGRGDALVGVLTDDGDEVVVYDALVDAELAIALLEVMARSWAPDQRWRRMCCGSLCLRMSTTESGAITARPLPGAPAR